MSEEIFLSKHTMSLFKWTLLVYKFVQYGYENHEIYVLFPLTMFLSVKSEEIFLSKHTMSPFRWTLLIYKFVQYGYENHEIYVLFPLTMFLSVKMKLKSIPM